MGMIFRDNEIIPSQNLGQQLCICMKSSVWKSAFPIHHLFLFSYFLWVEGSIFALPQCLSVLFSLLTSHAFLGSFSRDGQGWLCVVLPLDSQSQLLSNWVSESAYIYVGLSWGWGGTSHFNQNWTSAQCLSSPSLQTLASLMDSPPRLCYWTVISIQIGTYLVSVQSVATDEARVWSHHINYLRCSVYVIWAISKSWPTVCSVTPEDSLFSKGNSPSCELTSLES